MMSDPIRCNRCVMDSTADNFEIDEKGICNYCANYFKQKETALIGDQADYENKLNVLLKKIKDRGKKQKYDCIIGVSGGVDSTFVAYTVKKLGLRPLAVHLDNGWDSELAVANIERALEKLDIDLYTHVINWKEFKDIQLSFLKASIPGMEIPSDHAIFTILNDIAKKYKISFLINGSNFRMEKIMAPNWSEMVGQMDWKLIYNVHKEFGKEKIKTFPHMTRLKWYYSRIILRRKTINILNLIPFSKKEAMDIIQKELGWVYYGGKHYESIYTRFTQAYIQPRKFNIDKRKAHFSNLICMGEMTRKEAIDLLATDPYSDTNLRDADLEYFKKKLALSNKEFDSIMQSPIKSYKDYKGYFNSSIYQFIDKFAMKLHFWLKKVGFYG